jgi:hypothetical protein
MILQQRSAMIVVCSEPIALSFNRRDVLGDRVEELPPLHIRDSREEQLRVVLGLGVGGETGQQPGQLVGQDLLLEG